MKRKILFLISFIFLTLVVIAQNYITLHDACNFSGNQYELEIGRYRSYQMKINNDRLSSLQIPNGYKVIIYEHDNFQGISKTYTASTSCLETAWQYRASSIVVEGPVHNPGHPGTGNEFVTFFNDCNATGYSQSLFPGTYTGTQLGVLKFNISSFKITGNLRLRAYLNNENLSGTIVNFENDQLCLANMYNDKIGSLVIEYKSTSNPNFPDAGIPNSIGYATLFSECNKQGNAIRLKPGTYRGDQLGIMKFNTASIELSTGLRARVFIDNESLSGTSSIIDTDISCMNSSLRNRIGSLVIEENVANIPNNPPTTEKVMIYNDANYKGQMAALLPGTYKTMAAAGGFPDKALSSLIVPAGYRVVLYENENLGGKSYTVTQSKTGFLLSGWNDKTSSIAIYKN